MKQTDVRTSHGPVRVYASGGGPRPVLLLHGSGCDSAMLSWREVMSCFGDGFSVYALDFPGYGQSAAQPPSAGSGFYDAYIDIVKETADALGLERFTLAGLSMGGAVAIGFTLRFPERVSLLIPVDTWGITQRMPVHPFLFWYIHHANLTRWQYGLLAKSRTLAKWAVTFALIGNKRAVTDALLDEVMAACAGNPNAAPAGTAMQDFQLSSITRSGCVPYYADELSRLTMPVVFLHGEKDPLVHIRNAQAAAARTQTNRLVVLKGCKHWAVKERPEALVQIVRETL